MAKVQGKKSAAGKKAATTKPAARAKSAKPAPKGSSKGPVKAIAKVAAKAKAVIKKAVGKSAPKPAKAAPKATPKAAAAKPKSAAKATPKVAPKVTAKGAAPAKATKPTKPTPAAAPAGKPGKSTGGKAKAAAKTVAKVAAGTAVAAAATVAVAKVAAKAAPADDKKKRRSRTKISSGGPATATWFAKADNKPRPSSFIPAPPRAEAPSLVAAPPASSDRLVSNSELTEFVVRTVPVRIDIEANAGRTLVYTFPETVTLRVGEGIEWDFRYLNGADVVIDEVIIEIDKPSPFPSPVFRSRRPGINRPHRQLSGPVQKAAAGKQLRYTVRAMNAFKMEMAVARPTLAIQE
jgi:hypothetical protein